MKCFFAFLCFCISLTTKAEQPYEMPREVAEKIALNSMSAFCRPALVEKCFSFSVEQCKAEISSATGGCILALSKKQPKIFNDRDKAKGYAKLIGLCGETALINWAKQNGSYKKSCDLKL